MKNIKKKIAALMVSTSLLGVSTLALLPSVPIIPQAQAISAVEAILGGGVGMIYVNKVIGKMDNTDEGQQESLENTKEKTGYYDNASAQNRVKKVLDTLSQSPLVKRKYVVYVNPEDEYNAFMTIGRVMSVNKGSLEKLDDDELAYVMAHEISHGEHHDIVSGLKKQVGLSTAISAATAGNNGAMILGNIVGNYVANQVFTMSQEKAADDLGFQILATSPYNIGGAAASMVVLRNAYGDHYREGIKQVLAPNNHPKTSNRVLENSQKLTAFSNNHVAVTGSTVYVNGDQIYTPSDSGRYTGEERAYLMAGKLAKLYHNNIPGKQWAGVSGSTIFMGDTSIVTTESYSSAQDVATKLNTAIGKTSAITTSKNKKVKENKKTTKVAKDKKINTKNTKNEK